MINSENYWINIKYKDLNEAERRENGDANRMTKTNSKKNG